MHCMFICTCNLLYRQLKPLRTAPVASDDILGGFMNDTEIFSNMIAQIAENSFTTKDLALIITECAKSILMNHGNTTNSQFGCTGLTLSFNYWLQKGGAQELSRDEVLKIMDKLRKHITRYGKSHSYQFNCLIVLSDWHSPKWFKDLGFGQPAGNGSDLHFHMLFSGMPKSVIVKEIVNWWTKNHYGYYATKYSPRKDGNVRINNDIDRGALRYIISNYQESTIPTYRFVSNPSKGNRSIRAIVKDFALILPLTGTRDKTRDEGLVGDTVDTFSEFGIDLKP